MIRGVRNRMESHHGIKIEDSTIVFAVKMAKKYIPNRRLPDVGFDLVDTACASATIELESEPQEIMNLRNKIWSLELEKAAIERDFGIKIGENAVDVKSEKYLKLNRELKERIQEIEIKIEETKKNLIPLEELHAKERASISEAKNLKTQIENTLVKIEDAKRKNETLRVLDLQTDVLPVLEGKLKEIEGSILITASHVASVISRWTGVPVKRLTLKENERLMKMADRIKQKVFGQDEAVDSVVECILRNRVGLSEPNRPIGAFLFLGPSGVGKTELTKAIAYELFDDSKNMVVLDMSDYANETSITKLLGVSAGYIGYAEGGALTEPVKEKPYNVVLFDELDLAHPKVVNVLYQLLDEGRVTDGKRNIIDFSNTVIVMTSNLGQESILSGNAEYNEIEKMLNTRFGSALINRIDSICYFSPLKMVELQSILDLKVSQLNDSMIDRKVQLFISDKVKNDIIRKNFKPVYGARPVKRAVQSIFVGAITKIILNHSTEIERSEGVSITAYLPGKADEGIGIGDYVYVINFGR